MRCSEQFALFFDIEGEDPLRSIDYAQEKAFLVHIIRVARQDVVFRNFRADLSLSAGKWGHLTSTYELKVILIPRRAVCFPSRHVQSIKPGATELVTVASNEAVRPVLSDLDFRDILGEVLYHR